MTTQKMTDDIKIDKHRGLQVIFTVLDIFHYRGYDIPDQLEEIFNIPHRRFIYHEEVEELYKKISLYMADYDEYGIKFKYKSIWDFRFTAFTEKGKPIMFSFLFPREIGKSDKIKTKAIKYFSDHFHKLITAGAEPRLFICLIGKLIGMAKTNFVKIQKAAKIETFDIEQLLFNPLRHVMNGESRLLTEKEKDKLIEKVKPSPRVKDKFNCLPVVDEGDIVSKVLGADSGVIEFKRPNYKTSVVEPVYYRRINAIKDIRENLKRTEKHLKEKKIEGESGKVELGDLE